MADEEDMIQQRPCRARSKPKTRFQKTSATKLYPRPAAMVLPAADRRNRERRPAPSTHSTASADRSRFRSRALCSEVQLAENTARVDASDSTTDMCMGLFDDALDLSAREVQLGPSRLAALRQSETLVRASIFAPQDGDDQHAGAAWRQHRAASATNGGSAAGKAASCESLQMRTRQLQQRHAALQATSRRHGTAINRLGWEHQDDAEAIPELESAVRGLRAQVAEAQDRGEARRVELVVAEAARAAAAQEVDVARRGLAEITERIRAYDVVRVCGARCDGGVYYHGCSWHVLHVPRSPPFPYTHTHTHTYTYTWFVRRRGYSSIKTWTIGSLGILAALVAT